MKSITLSKTIQATPRDVFEAFADFPHAADRVTGITRIEMLTDGPIGRGTKFRESRVMFKREASEEMEVTRFEPGKSYTVEAESCGSHWASEFTFAAEGSGTRVNLEVRMRPVTFFAKVMSPLGKLMAGSMAKCIEQDMDDLRKSIEGRDLQGEAGATA